MSSLLPMPVAPPPPTAGPPPKPGGRSAQPEGDPFASVLARQARTATAEGPSKQPEANDASTPSDAPVDSAPKQDAVDVARPPAEGTDPAAVAAAIADFLGISPTTAETPAGAAGQPAAAAQAATAQPAVPAAAAAVPPPGAGTAADATGANAAPSSVATGTTTAADAAAAPAAPSALPADADGAPASQPAATATATAAEATAAGATAAGDGAEGQSGAAQQQTSGRDPRAAAGGAQATPGATPAHAAADAGSPGGSTAGAATPSANGAAQAAATTQPAATQPATPQPATPTAAPALHGQPLAAAAGADAPAAAEPARGAVTLERAIETVRLALRAGAERGVTHARIALSPQELGGIEIHLRHTVDGIVARVVADATGAAQLLQQSAGDLRRQLEQQGVNVLRLDVGASGEEQRRAGAQSGFGEPAGRDARGDAGTTADELIAVGTTTATTGPLELPNGALVNVLA